MAVETNSREIVRRLKREDWILESINGSHHKFKHPQTGEIVIVPHPKKDLPFGLARAIAKQAGWL